MNDQKHTILIPGFPVVNMVWVHRGEKTEAGNRNNRCHWFLCL